MNGHPEVRKLTLGIKKTATHKTYLAVIDPTCVQSDDRLTAAMRKSS